MADEQELFLKELDSLSKMADAFGETTDIFKDIESRFPTAAILDKQAKEIKQPDLSAPKIDALVALNEELLDVTAEDVVGGIEELTDLFKDGIPVAPSVGEQSDDGAIDDMLKSIQSIAQGSDFTKRPEFLEFMDEQDENAKDLLKGTEEDRTIGLEMLTALALLREDNKESITSLMKQQDKADRRSFKDVGKDIAGKIPGFQSIKGIGIQQALEGALIAGIAGWEIGKRLEQWMDDNWQIRDQFADAMDILTGIDTKEQLGHQVLSPEEQAENIRIQARKELIKEFQAGQEQLRARTDIGEEERTVLIQTKEEQIDKLAREIGKIAAIEPGELSIPDSPMVLEKLREQGKRERAKQQGVELDNSANKVFRAEVLKGREPVSVTQQTTVIPVPAPAVPRPAPQKQIDDFGNPLMHQFMQ